MASAKVMSDNMVKCHDGLPKCVMDARPKVTGMKPLVVRTTKTEVSRTERVFLRIPMSAAI